MPLSHLDNDHERRFGGVERLYGEGTRVALHRGRVAVVGVGGVGSWAVEALARSGVGQITMIDFDHVAASNMNRQIHALDGTLGAAKVSVLEARIRNINPACKVVAVDEFLTEKNLADLISQGALDAVIDACDDTKVKAALIAHARFCEIPLIVCGGVGGKSNPLNLRQADLGLSAQDALLARVRDRLRREFGIRPRKNGKFGVPCVYLEEPARRSGTCTTGNLNCAGYGSAVTVTASMGFAAAAWCLERLVALK
ncbi:MAG: tRNA threonylcarbamoyladenosine dehydratase [Gallionella sp.]